MNGRARSTVMNGNDGRHMMALCPALSRATSVRRGGTGAATSRARIGARHRRDARAKAAHR